MRCELPGLPPYLSMTSSFDAVISNLVAQMFASMHLQIVYNLRSANRPLSSSNPLKRFPKKGKAESSQTYIFIRVP